MSNMVNPIAIDLIKDSTKIIDLAKALKAEGFSFARVKSIYSEICIAVEKYTKTVGVLSSEAKIEIATDMVNIVVDIPYVPEWLERKIFRYGIKKAIKYFNDTFGKDWLNKLTD